VSSDNEFQSDPDTTRANRGESAVGGPLSVPGYDLMPEIARGAMGIVYLARDLTLDREVAVKVMKPGMDASVFVREARVTAQLPHPGIPPVHALGTLPDERPYLVMKLIRGDTLDKVLKARTDRTTDHGHLLAAFEQMCQAVGYAHSQDIIHRDLKPSNVMVGAFGEVQVMDWGLAKKVGGGDPEATVPHGIGTPGEIAATVAGQVKGTPAYMAPEQARGEPVDARADVFALGGILAAILTGHPPFKGNSVLDTIIRAAQAELDETFARIDASGADAELRTLCKKCLAPRAVDRYANAEEVALAVAGYRAEVEERLRQAERKRAAEEARTIEEANTRREAEARAAEQRKRRQAQRALAAAVLLLVVAGGFGAVVASLWHTSEANRAEAVTQRDQADTARNDALQQKLIADGAKTEALTQRDAANVAKNDALQQKRIADGAKDEAIKAKEDALRQKQIADSAKEEALKAKDDAVKLRQIADVAKDEAIKAKGIAEKAQVAEANARKQVELERQKLAVFEYGATMRVAHQEWRDNNVIAMRALLDGADPKLRNWEWHHLNRLCDPSLLTLKGHTDRVNAASFSADGTRIVTGSWDNTAKVWDTKTGAELLTLKGHTNSVNAASFSADGTRIVTGSWDNTAKVWDTKTGAELLTLKGHTDWVNAASFSADGTRIITGSSDKTAKVWDAKTGAELLTLKGHTFWVLAASFSADGTRIVTGSYDKTAKVWDAKTGAELLTLKGHTDSVYAASFSADGTRIVTGSYDNTAKVWDTKTGAELLTLKGHTFWVLAASFSADGTRIVTGSYDKTAKVWDAKTGAELLTLKGHTDRVYAASFSADGTRIVTGSYDNTAKVWDTKTGAELLTLKGHTNSVNAASFSADGTRIVTGSYDKTAKVWDAKTGAELLTLKRHTYRVWAASFSADGTRIVTGSEDKTAKVWDARPFRDSRPPDPELAPPPREK